MSVTVTKVGAAKTALWSFVENGGLAILSFVSLVVYSRFLSPSDFGLFSIVLAFVELLGVLVTNFFHDALVQKPDVTRTHFDTAFTFTMGLSIALFAGCVVFQALFARVVNYPAAGRVLAWTALCLPCSALSATIVPWQRRQLEYRALALRSLIGRLCGAVLGIILVVLGAHFWGLVAQYVLIALAGSLVLWAMASQRPRLRFGMREFSSMLGFSSFAVGSMLLNYGIGRLFTIVVGISLGTTAAGYLNLSFRAVDVFWSIAATAVSQAAFPVLARMQSDDHRLRRAYASAVEFSCLTLYPCFIGMALIAPELVELLFGRAWLVSTPYVRALALLIVLRAPRQLGRPLLTAVGRPQDGLVGLVGELVLVASMLAIWGARSLAWAMAIWVAREVLSLPLVAYLVKRATGIGYSAQFRGARVALLASGFMGALVFLLRQVVPPSAGPTIRLAVLVPAGAAAYLAAAWLLNRSAVLAAGDFIISAARRRAAHAVET